MVHNLVKSPDAKTSKVLSLWICTMSCRSLSNPFLCHNMSQLNAIIWSVSEIKKTKKTRMTIPLLNRNIRTDKGPSINYVVSRGEGGGGGGQILPILLSKKTTRRRGGGQKLLILRQHSLWTAPQAWINKNVVYISPHEIMYFGTIFIAIIAMDYFWF